LARLDITGIFVLPPPLKGRRRHSVFGLSVRASVIMY